MTTKEKTALEKTREKEMTTREKKLTTLSDLLNDPSSQAKMAKAAPAYLNTETLTRVALTAVQKNEALMKVSAGSILQACMDCAAYGLVPNSMTNEAHLVPFGNSCVLVVGYKGLIKLATNTGLVSAVKVRKVFENDFFKYELGLNDILEHKPATSNPGKFIGCYAVVVFTDGTQDFRYVSKEEGLAHGKRFSKNFGSKSSTWKLDEEAMICKTAVRMVLKYVPSSPENLKRSEALSRAITSDERMESGAGIIDIEQAEEIRAPKPVEASVDVDPETGEVIPPEEEDPTINPPKELFPDDGSGN
jgi:recombination protein RecT